MTGFVQPLDPHAKGRGVADLHAVLTELGYTISQSDVDSQSYGASTVEAVRRFQSDRGVPVTGAVDEATAELLAESSALRELARSVSGSVVFEYGLPAANIVVRAYHRVYGGNDTLLIAGTTGSDGRYALSYRAEDPVNLELRTVDAAGQEVALSEPKFGADWDERFKLVAPASVRPLEPEFRRLAADVEQAAGDRRAIGAAQESDGRADLSIMSRTTGWDARLLALAASATVLSEKTKVPAEALYGLFRTGLPTDATHLARADSRVIDRALKRAVEAGLIGRDSVKPAGDALASFAREGRRGSKTPGAVSSLGELLDNAGLTDTQREQWEEIYFSTPPDALWKTAERQLPAEAVQKLQLQGKLAALTLNNAPLMKVVQEQASRATGLAGLVDAGLYKAEEWQKQIRDLAGGNLDQAIPSAYAASSTDDRAAAYAEDMARKVRLAFPTRVVGHMLEQGELKLPGSGETVGKLLKQASEQGFELGRMPVEHMFRPDMLPLKGNGRRNGRARRDAIARPDEETVNAVKAVARVFQIAPSNEAMAVLLEEGIHSAHDVAGYTCRRFIEHHGHKFGSIGEAYLVCRKATQVSSVTYGLFTSARALDSSTPVSVISGDPMLRQQAKDNISNQYPTMKQLFGSLDFCECKECRSVLSPAAYLVDLFQFINPTLVWDAFTLDWNSSHAKHFAANFASDYDKPFDQLDHRRPDLKSLPLTCENTNTALPYIDIVNEILEYYVVNGSLAGDPGHDTGDATSRELLAEPQFILPAAYDDTLLRKSYPIGLPFDLWIETVRAFLAYFEVPLADLLETFRASDDLFKPQGGTAPYYRSQVFVESLGITPAEWALYTKTNAAASWWALYGYTTDNAARTALASAKTLSQKLAVSYKELVQLLETGFVNPQLAKLVGLSKIGIDVGEVYRYENAPGAAPMTTGEKTAFEQQLADFKTATGFDAKAWVNARYADHTFDSILVLADPDPGCNFDDTKLQYANGDPATNVDFVNLNLFVRLWRSLGWKIDELDRALCALMPPNASPLTSANLGPALGTAIIYLAHLSALNDDLSLGAGARLKLPALWTNISTTGANSLYAQLFLTPRALKNDPIFDDPVGDYLHDNTKFLKDHRVGVQAALTLTAREVDLIIADTKINPDADARINLDTAPLSLANVSLLYRYGLLARALKLSIADFIALKTLSGLDPFAAIKADPLNADPPPPDDVSPLSDDHPFSQTLRFVQLAGKVSESGFSIAELAYLLVHDPDSVAQFRPDGAPALSLMGSLRSEIERIKGANSPPDDPATLDDDTLRQKLALVLPASVADTFMGMWSGTIEYSAVPENVTPANALDPDSLTDFPISVSYDATTQEQRLTFTGVLLQPQRQQIEAANNSAVLSALLGDVQAQASNFYNRWFLDFLQPADYNTLFKPIPTAPVAAAAAIAARRTAVANGLYPYLQAKLIRQLVVNSLAATLAADPVLIDTLVSDSSLLHDPTAGGGEPMLAAFACAADAGLTAEWYGSDDLTGATLAPPATVATADTSVKPAGTGSARFRGCLQVTATGPFRFFVKLDKKDAIATLRFDHLTDPVIAAKAAADGDEPSGRVDLKAGVPYPFTLEVQALGTGDARMCVLGETLPKEPLDHLTLYPQSVYDRVRHADTVMAKVLRLITGFGLSEREVAHMLSHPADFSGLDLSSLPADETTTGAPARFEQFMRLAGYAALKRALELDGDDLIDVFAHARRSFTGPPAQAVTDLLTDLYARVAALTRRDADTVKLTAQQLGFAASSPAAGTVEAPDFAQERGLQRLWDALSLIEMLGVAADAVGRWVPIVNPSAANRSAIADDVKNTVKSRFEDDAWYAIAQPTFDSLRKLKRDALVAYVVDKEGFDSPDRIYQHFFLDPEMQPVVQTSRIQAAIASTQLFIQRCLLNLEERVPPPAIIDAGNWAWMKRYRFWEANRRIFLYPENWLEPEFRDDKTSLFKDLEAALLKGDVTSDAAEDAFLGYLQTLESIARLQAVSMYVEEPDDAVDILHVFARTYSVPHKYYYRRFSDFVWSAWEPVDVEIAGDHVAAVKWRDRMHVFWVTFVDKAEPTDDTKDPRDLADTTVNASNQNKVEVRLNWTACVDGTWTAPSAGPPFTTIEQNVTATFDRKSVPIFVSKEKRADGSEGAVRIHVGGQVQKMFRMATKNSPPTVVDDSEQAPRSYYNADGWDATMRRGDAPLSIYYPEKVDQDAATGRTETTNLRQQILGAMPEGAFDLLLGDSSLRLPRPDLAPLAGPFFYEDDTNAFFVAPEVHEDTFDIWEKWVVEDPGEVVDLGSIPDWWAAVNLSAHVPHKEPDPPDREDPWKKFEVENPTDWLTNPATILQWGGSFVGEHGGVDISTTPITEETGREAVVAGGPGSSDGAGTAYVSTAKGQTAKFTQGSAVVIVGDTGLNGPAAVSLQATKALASSAGGAIG
jgi:hypothetical protein